MAAVLGRTLRVLSAGRALARPRALVSTDPKTEAVVKKDQKEAAVTVESVPADEIVRFLIVFRYNAFDYCHLLRLHRYNYTHFRLFPRTK